MRALNRRELRFLREVRGVVDEVRDPFDPKDRRLWALSTALAFAIAEKSLVGFEQRVEMFVRQGVGNGAG